MARRTRNMESQNEGIVSNSDIPEAPAETLNALSDEINNVPAVVAPVISTSGDLAIEHLESISSPVIPDTVNEVASSCGLESDEKDDEVTNSPEGTLNPKKTDCKKKIKKIQKRASPRGNNDLEDDRLMELLLDGFMDDEDFDFDYDQPAALMSSIKRNRRTANHRPSQRTRRYQKRYNSHDL